MVCLLCWFQFPFFLILSHFYETKKHLLRSTSVATTVYLTEVVRKKQIFFFVFVIFFFICLALRSNQNLLFETRPGVYEHPAQSGSVWLCTGQHSLGGNHPLYMVKWVLTSPVAGGRVCGGLLEWSTLCQRNISPSVSDPVPWLRSVVHNQIATLPTFKWLHCFCFHANFYWKQFAPLCLQ